MQKQVPRAFDPSTFEEHKSLIIDSVANKVETMNVPEAWKHGNTVCVLASRTRSDWEWSPKRKYKSKQQQKKTKSLHLLHRIIMREWLLNYTKIIVFDPQTTTTTATTIIIIHSSPRDPLSGPLIWYIQECSCYTRREEEEEKEVKIKYLHKRFSTAIVLGGLCWRLLLKFIQSSPSAQVQEHCIGWKIFGTWFKSVARALKSRGKYVTTSTGCYLKRAKWN